jgi:outer membrane biosynthesis protein TonB
MDENLEHKIRGLKLKILQTEKELSRSLHNVNLGAWLHAGHPTQMAKAGERERKRLEAKLADLREQLNQLAPGSVAQPPTATTRPEPAPARVEAKPPVPAPLPPPAPTTAKPKPAAKSSKTAPAAKSKPKKKAAGKKPAASRSAKAKKR